MGKPSDQHPIGATMPTNLENEIQAFERFVGHNGATYLSLEEALAAFRRAQQRCEPVLEPSRQPLYARPPRTELGACLRELRAEIVAGGETLLDDDALEREVQERKGNANADTFS